MPTFTVSDEEYRRLLARRAEIAKEIDDLIGRLARLHQESADVKERLDVFWLEHGAGAV